MNSTRLLLLVASAPLLCLVHATGTPEPSGPAATTSRDTASTPPAALRPREELAAQIDRNVEANEHALAAARAQARQLSAQDQRRFRAAERSVRLALRRLHHSLDVAERASAGDWESARAALAADYDAYTQAVAQAQQIATATVAINAPRDAPETARSDAPAD